LAGGVPSLQQRRENALETKRRLARLYGDAVPTPPEPRPWDDLRADIPDALRPELDSRLILDEDIRETIWTAEQSGEKFRLESENADGAVFQACLVKPVVVYWVRYCKKTRAGDAYDVLDAYSHRMHFSREG
jgi:hypothetical protein